jgi:hypothetical protein
MTYGETLSRCGCKGYRNSRKCSGCSAPIRDANQSGYCRPCMYASCRDASGSDRQCAACSTPIQERNTSGLCRPCYRKRLRLVEAVKFQIPTPPPYSLELANIEHVAAVWRVRNQIARAA